MGESLSWICSVVGYVWNMRDPRALKKRNAEKSLGAEGKHKYID